MTADTHRAGFVKPNFFIVGAPKCGTTSMAHYLKQHPQIFISWYKEPHFFGSDLRAAKYIRDEEKYLNLFRDGGAYPRRGEASTWYLYSARAAQEIRAYCPDARIIAMLRNPIEMSYSLHSHNLYTGSEDVPDFGEALALEAERKQGRRIPSGAPHPAVLFYREAPKFAAQLLRYFEAFGRDNVHVVLFDDFRRDTAAVYRQTLEFLGVDSAFVPEFRVINANQRVRSGAIRTVLRNPRLQRIVRAVVPLQLAEAVARGLRAMNTVPEPRPPLEARLRDLLRKEFAPDVARLSKLLGRDLHRWIAS
ncbi:sulfotransferase [soil metagenome]